MSKLTVNTTKHRILHENTVRLLEELADAWDPGNYGDREYTSVSNSVLERASKLYEELRDLEVQP